MREIDEHLIIEEQIAGGLQELLPTACFHRRIRFRLSKAQGGGYGADILADHQPVPQGATVVEEYAQGDQIGPPTKYQPYGLRDPIAEGIYRKIHDHGQGGYFCRGVPVRLEPVKNNP